MPFGRFEFRGTGGSYFWLCIWTTVLTTLTLGLFYPWAECAVQKWKAKNTYIENKQLVFKGTGGGLFGTWLLIIILCIITLGIYIPWGFCRLERWKTNNLYFAGHGDNENF
ncbi:putative membrane protein [Sphaerochaeta pleomorpha str. Grapes]|uniref:Putative membrane protein n=1 Tax=Sphaerochaeta pleomorpha (strain ATCC BAA-1885 / DSM 22778 / Grapes) TaxID=158190 RepID=G8QRQ5_SPHPG|nr:putative membrane protein [Sphaerochaeta pleomorpha str. Grapes]